MKTDKFRIKEVALKKDGTDIWFYPEICVLNTKTKGMLWWKTSETIEEWETFFKSPKSKKPIHYSKTHRNGMFFSESEHVIGFRTIIEAEAWIEDYKEKELIEARALSTKWMKYVASTIEAREAIKIHQID